MFGSLYDLVWNKQIQVIIFPLDLAMAKYDVCWSIGIIPNWLVRICVIYGNWMVVCMMCSNA